VDSAGALGRARERSAHGTLTLHSTGWLQLHAATNFSGSDSFTYKASDGQLLK